MTQVKSEPPPKPYEKLSKEEKKAISVNSSNTKGVLKSDEGKKDLGKRGSVTFGKQTTFEIDRDSDEDLHDPN